MLPDALYPGPTMNTRGPDALALGFILLAACSDSDSSGDPGSGAAATAASGMPSATGTGGAATSSGTGGDGGDSCNGGAPVTGPTGATIEMNPGDSLARAGMANPGDLVQVHGGSYAQEDIQAASPMTSGLQPPTARRLSSTASASRPASTSSSKGSPSPGR